MSTATMESTRLRAGDVMTREVLSVPGTMSVDEVATFLVEHEISGAPVIDAGGKLIGVVSVADLAAAVTEGGGVVVDQPSPMFYFRGPEDREILRGWEESYSPEDLTGLHVAGGGRTVSDVMSTAVHTIDEQATVAEIARMMVAGHFHRLLVLREGELAGIVTSMDLLRVLTDDGAPASRDGRE